MNKKELDKKTIFDFCDNPEVAASYNGGYKTQDSYRRALGELSDKERESYRIFAILDYADDSGKTELASIIRREYKDELEAYFNE